MAAAMDDSDTEDSSDADAAVESAVSHNNPFAALNGEEDSTAAESVAEPDISDSGSEHSASTLAGLEGHLNGGTISASHSKPHRHKHEHAEPDLSAQRQAILAKIRGSNTGWPIRKTGMWQSLILRCCPCSLPESAWTCDVNLSNLSHLFCVRGPRLRRVCFNHVLTSMLCLRLAQSFAV